MKLFRVTLLIPNIPNIGVASISMVGLLRFFLSLPLSLPSPPLPPRPRSCTALPNTRALRLSLSHQDVQLAFGNTLIRANTFREK